MVPPRIDVHAHFLPPDYLKACTENGHAHPDGMPALPQWSEEAHLDLMSKIGISKSILSISTPGTHLVAGNSELAKKVTRYCNSYAASMKKRLPEKFGYWASLPLPDIELSLAEIEQSSKEGADGFALETNHHGHYLGDSMFDPVFDELNRRKATIFIHPTSPCIACEQGPPIKAAPLASKYPNPMLEFFFDTARAVTNLFLSGTIARCPDITFVIPHAGGATIPLLSRFTGFSSIVPGLGSVTEEQAKDTFVKQFYFDLAGFAFPSQIVGLVKGVGVSPSKLLYGSDFPFTPTKGCQGLAAKMDAGVKEMFTDEEIEDIYHRNATKLLESLNSSKL